MNCSRYTTDAQIDLKWVAGIFACVAIVVSGVLFSLAGLARDE